jgi:hypothetical protein
VLGLCSAELEVTVVEPVRIMFDEAAAVPVESMGHELIEL